MIQISVINQTRGMLQNTEVQAAIRAVNCQIYCDFYPYTQLGGKLSLSGYLQAIGRQSSSGILMSGDALIYLCDESNQASTLEYHRLNHQGMPFEIVHLQSADQFEVSWSARFSRKALELIFTLDDNPTMSTALEREEHVGFHWYQPEKTEQEQEYTIEGVALSNFYFSQSNARELGEA
ncbi:MAG: hypothetical protein GQ582_09855 [Methyloprofundus sp.]|nr:hypothetical protein [Methyloprofundus sp.]